MTLISPVQTREKIMGRLSSGSDLLNSLTDICKEMHIRLGTVHAIGAVKKAQIGYYDQKENIYLYKWLENPLEITHLTGNISVKDGHPFIHAHITLADREGNCFGGHLAAGTVVFACEFVIEVLEGAYLIRKQDSETGLSLWIADDPSS